MTVTQVLALLGGIGMVLAGAARLPSAAAQAVRACIELVEALHELRAAWRDRGPDA